MSKMKTSLFATKLAFEIPEKYIDNNDGISRLRDDLVVKLMALYPGDTSIETATLCSPLLLIVNIRKAPTPQLIARIKKRIDSTLVSWAKKNVVDPYQMLAVFPCGWKIDIGNDTRETENPIALFKYKSDAQEYAKKWPNTAEIRPSQVNPRRAWRTIFVAYDLEKEEPKGIFVFQDDAREYIKFAPKPNSLIFFSMFIMF